MKSWLPFVAAIGLLGISGCKPSEPSSTTMNSAQEPPNTSTNVPTGGSETIAPMGGVGAGPMTPVSGTESVQGGGSAAGSVMKEKARGIAGSSPSSLNQMPADEGN